MFLLALIAASIPLTPNPAAVLAGWGDAQVVVSPSRLLCVLAATAADVYSMCFGATELAPVAAADPSIEDFREVGPVEVSSDLDTVYWDVNRDGGLDAADLQATINTAGTACPPGPATCYADTDGLGSTDGGDIDLILTRLLDGVNCVADGFCFTEGAP